MLIETGVERMFFPEMTIWLMVLAYIREFLFEEGVNPPNMLATFMIVKISYSSGKYADY